MTECFNNICRNRLLDSLLTVWPVKLLSFTPLSILLMCRPRSVSQEWKSGPLEVNFEAIILCIETGNPPLTPPNRGRQLTCREGIDCLLLQKWTMLEIGGNKLSTIPSKAAPFFLPGLTTFRKLLP